MRAGTKLAKKLLPVRQQYSFELRKTLYHPIFRRQITSYFFSFSECYRHYLPRLPIKKILPQIKYQCEESSENEKHPLDVSPRKIGMEQKLGGQPPTLPPFWDRKSEECAAGYF